jgi:hypothetical protein
MTELCGAGSKWVICDELADGISPPGRSHHGSSTAAARPGCGPLLKADPEGPSLIICTVPGANSRARGLYAGIEL